MANLQAEQVGSDILLLVDNSGDGTPATLIGGQTGATLNLTAGVTDINTKEVGLWRNTIEGLQSWSIDADQLYTEDDGSHDVAANGEGEISITYNGTTAVIKGLDSLDGSLSLTTDTSGALENDLWERNIATGLEAEFSTSGSYFDPQANDGAAYDLLLSAQEARTTVDAVVTFGVLELSASLRPGDWSLDAPGDQSRASIDFTLLSEGEVTSSTVSALDTGLQALLDAFFAPQTLIAGVEIQDGFGNGRLAGSTYWTGPCWASSIDFNASFGDPLSISAQLPGDGPLTRAV